MYKALVRSHLDYCDIIYHIPSTQDQFVEILNSLMEKAERIQYQAALAITGAWQGSNRSKLHDELGWESYLIGVGEFYRFVKLRIFHLPILVFADITTNINYFRGIRCKSEHYVYSFFPDGINSWNNVITHFKNIPSIEILKNTSYVLFFQRKKYLRFSRSFRSSKPFFS